MRKIYEYQLSFTDWQTLRLPEGYKVLSVDMQGSTLCLWAEVYSDHETTEQLEVYIYGTGMDIPDVSSRTFMKTLVLGNFVWHVYIRK